MSPEALDSMAQQIAGVNWAQVTFPAHRAEIMRLALMDENNSILDAISGDLSLLVKEAANLNGWMDTLTDQMVAVEAWFDKSKLWEGETYVRSS
jgi:hypothetical protein